MKKMMKLMKLILVLAVAGCGTAPKVHNFDRSKSLQASKDEVWLNVIDFFASNSLQIKTIEKDSGIGYAESGNFDSRFADCGDFGLAIPIQNSGEFNVFVRERGDDTEVVVNTTYRQVRRFGNYPPFVVDCNSTGYLEQLVLNSAGESIGVVQPSRGAIAIPSTPRSVEIATENPSSPRPEFAVRGHMWPVGRAWGIEFIGVFGAQECSRGQNFVGTRIGRF